MDKIVVAFIYRDSKTKKCTDDIVTFDFVSGLSREKLMLMAFKLGDNLCKLKGYDKCEWARFSICSESELTDELKLTRSWLNGLWDAYYYFREPVPSWFVSSLIKRCEDM